MAVYCPTPPVTGHVKTEVEEDLLAVYCPTPPVTGHVKTELEEDLLAEYCPTPGHRSRKDTGGGGEPIC